MVGSITRFHTACCTVSCNYLDCCRPGKIEQRFRTARAQESDKL